MTPPIITGPASAPTIVFLHGATGNQQMWTWHRSRLEDRYRIIGLDLPGHGKAAARRFSMPAAIAATVEAIGAEPTRPVLAVGISLGGYVAIETAHTHPGLVDGLVLSGATATYTGWGGLTTRLSGVVTWLAGPLLRKKATSAIASLFRPEIAEPLVEAGISMKGGAQALMTLPGTDHHGMLDTFAGHIRIVNGERDSVNRAEEDAAAAAWPNATVHTIVDAGHVCAFTKPEEFLTHIEAAMLSLVGDATA